MTEPRNTARQNASGEEKRIRDIVQREMRETLKNGMPAGTYSSYLWDGWKIVGGGAAPAFSASFLRQISFSVTANNWRRVPWDLGDLDGTNMTHTTDSGDIVAVAPAGLSGAVAYIYSASAGFPWEQASGWRHIAIMEESGSVATPSKSILAVSSLLLDNTTICAQTVSCKIRHTSAGTRYSVWVQCDVDTALDTGDIGGWGGEGSAAFFHMTHIGTIT
jgi:hypothetical protein